MDLTPDDLDAGKRLAEAVRLHLLADPDHATGQWVAFRLVDGRTDNTVYPTRGIASDHQSNPNLCGYLRITPDGITDRNAATYVAFNRRLHDKGYRMPDPETQHATDHALWVPNRAARRAANRHRH